MNAAIHADTSFLFVFPKTTGVTTSARKRDSILRAVDTRTHKRTHAQQSMASAEELGEAAGKKMFAALKLIAAKKNVDLAELVNSSQNALKYEFKAHKIASMPIDSDLPSSDAIVSTAEFTRLVNSPDAASSFLGNADNAGKALWCHFFDKLIKLDAKPGLESTVCTKLHMGSTASINHDDVQLVQVATGKKININCKTVCRAVQYGDTPSYQVHCKDAVKSVDAYFVVMWNKGIRSLPKCNTVEQLLDKVHSCVLVAVSDMKEYRGADNFRVNTNVVSLTGETEIKTKLKRAGKVSSTKKTAAPKRRKGFSKLKVLGVLAPHKEVDPVSLQNIHSEFSKQSH